MSDGKNFDTLIMVFTVFRHGDRGPICFLPNDKNKEFWGNHHDTLTKKGKQQAYELGLWYRKHYDGFIPAEFNGNEVYVYSTDSNRTLMSAQCVTSAMYPPNGRSQWHDSIQWQPIPVHVNPNPSDQFDALAKALDCDTFPGELCTTPLQKELFDNYLKNKHLWDGWHRFFYGDAKVNVVDVAFSVDNVVNAMKCGLPYEIPPNFDFKTLCKSVEEGIQLSAEITPIGSQLGTNVLTTIDQCINKKRLKNKSTKMYIYSAHDFHIYSVLGQLNVNLPRPQYCACLIFELHKLSDGKDYVKVLYRPSYNSEVMNASLAENQEYLPLQHFKNIVENSQTRVQSNK